MSLENSESSQTEPVQPIGVGRCLGGGVVAGGIAIALYNATSAIALHFATHPIHSNNFTVQRLSSAVRTLVVGLSTLGTSVFGLAAIGLIALALQVWLQRPKTTD